MSGSFWRDRHPIFLWTLLRCSEELNKDCTEFSSVISIKRFRIWYGMMIVALIRTEVALKNKVWCKYMLFFEMHCKRAFP